MYNFLKELEAKRRFKRQQRELMGEPAEEHPPALTGDMVIGKVGFEGVTWSPRPDCPYEYKGPNPLPLRNRIDQEDMSMDFSNQPAPQEQGTPEVLRTHSQEEIQEHYRMLGIPMGQKIARTDKNGSSGTDDSESGAQTSQGPIGSGSEDLFVTMGDFFENVQTDFGGHNMESMDKITPMEMDFGEPVRGAPIYGGPPKSASARKPAPLNLGGPMRYDLYEPRSSGSKRGGPTTYGQFREGQPAPTPPIHTPASMDIGRPMSAQSVSTFGRLTATPIRDPIQPSGPTTGALSVVSINCTNGPDGAGASQDPEPARSHLENMILQLERGYRERLHKKDLEIGILRTSNNFLHKALKEKNDHCAQFHSSMTTISTPGSSGTNSPMVSAKPTMSFENALAIFQEWMKNTKPQIERNMGIEFESLSVEQQTKWNACAQLLTKYQWELSGLDLIQPMTVEQKTQKDSEKRMGRKRGGSSGEMTGGV
ncbi:Protein CBG26204 [Caenorhabditis briggsae]|uniref:Protein CBG26204 n=1 Tax=Caenorhabditis briggsae TaxID=6238 RepID=B6ILU9_CAEBR|nr:Protein CBG26204 [Caenorhabditis briggsae]CAS00879.1 Protein CBG26204 [Caenorhabditis briggsae]